MRMNEQDLAPVAEAKQMMAEDTALQLFQIAALMLGDEQEAVSLVEEVVAKVEADPCAEGTLAYAEARTLLVRTAVQRMAGLYPEAFAVPTAQPAADAGCIETDDLGAAGFTGEQFGALVSGAGRAGMREWLERLAPALRAIFVLRAVAGQDGEQTAESLRQSGATGAQGWRRDQVGTAYRQALCLLATCLMSAQTALMPA
jgi:DNA-directed RNA polymerase specialized sigma24 family protein